MKYFNKKLKIFSLLLALVLLFNLSLTTITFAEEESAEEDIALTEEELELEEEVRQELEDFEKENNKEHIDMEGDESSKTPTDSDSSEEEEPQESVETKKHIDTFEFRFFKAAGILVPELYELQENAPMTRAQFVSIASRLCGLGNVTFPSTNSYWDVPAGHWAASYIYGMRDMHYVSGYSEHEFRPDEPITYGQALKITLSILGYNDNVVQKYGSYPEGHIRLGSKLDLLPNVSSADSVVFCKKALELLYKATEVELLESVFKDGEYVYTKSGETLLSEYFDIYEDDGILTFDGYTGLDSDEKLAENQVVIGGRILERNGIDVQKLLGMSVRYFYCRSTSDYELVYVEAKENANKVLIIDAEDLAIDDPQFSVNNICYYDKNDRIRVANISQLARFVYNGRSYDEFGSSDYKIEAGTLTLISHSGSNAYDVIIAQEFENCFVNAVDLQGRKIYDSYGGVIELEEYDYVTIFNEAGDSISLENISKNNVVSCFHSLDGENLILYVSESKVSGVISAISNDGRKGITYTIGEKEYRLAANVMEAIAKNLIDICSPELGFRYDVYLDKAGRIAGLVMTEEKMQYALFCASSMDKGINSDRCLLKLVLESGELVIAQTAKKFTVNGVNSTGAALKSALDTYSDYPVIRVAFNGLGEIREIELAADKSTYDDDAQSGDKTPVGYNEEKFTMDFSGDKIAYRGYSIMVFYDKYRMNPDTVVFLLPYKESGETIEPEEVTVVPSSYLSHGQAYNITLYDADATLSVNAVVAQPTNFGYYNGLFVVNKVSHVTNESGDDVIRITGFQKGVLTTLTEKEPGIILKAKETLASKRPDLQGLDKNRVKTGDVFRFYSVDGEIVAGQLLYSCSVPKQRYIATFSKPTSDRLYSNQVIVSGPVHAVSPYAVTTVNPDTKTEITGSIASHTLYNTVIMVYDSQEDNVYLGSMADILPDTQPDKSGTITFDDNSTWIVIYRQSDTANEIIVIK